MTSHTDKHLFAGEEKLKKQAEKFTRRVEKINDQVWFFSGFGGSNMIAVLGDDSCILIDTLNGKEPAEAALAELRTITDKPIRTIIYTHTHFDHTAGAGVFADSSTEIIAHTYKTQIYGHSELLDKISRKRGMRQFGSVLTREESICMGIGIWNNPYNTRAILPPNRLIDDESVSIVRGGVEFQLIAAPGETDDQIFVWLPEFKILCCGDNYYESWPNLYAIRGSQYRDISSWIQSLERMLNYPARILLPGHTGVIRGEETIRTVLTDYHDAIEYVLTETLKGMDQGLTADELAETVSLPERFAELPYLQEYYGTVQGTVRAIFTGYLGWFDGNPTSLNPLPLQEYSDNMIRMMGGAESVITEIDSSLDDCRYQWAAQLCDLLLHSPSCPDGVKKKKARALTGLGRMQTSANSRHYYLVCAKELEA